MRPEDRHEQARRLSEKYRKASKKEKTTLLDGFCATTGLNRKYAIALLREPPETKRDRGKKGKRETRYGPPLVKVLETIWEAADFPWSVRLKAMIPLWLPHLPKGLKVTPEMEADLLAISPRTIDRKLKPVRVATHRRLYGRTKPGTLLKHQIPVRTERWDVDQPGWGEIDLVSHSGARSDGEFAHSMNFTDIHSTWVETRAVLGKGQTGVLEALDDIREQLPFTLRGIDSDNGSEFINYHVLAFCEQHSVQFTRGRPYKKDDNAHVEQKNWTHVRRLVGWERIDTRTAVQALNDLYCHEWRWMMNLFQPSVKLLRKERIGSRVRRVYEQPTTPLDRLLRQTDHPSVKQLATLRDTIDPFELSNRVQAKIDHVHRLARRPIQPEATTPTASCTTSLIVEDHPLLNPPPRGGGRPLTENEDVEA